MAHEITNTDHVVLHCERAWHGLGTIVQDAPTPTEALRLAKLDWTVEQWPLSATDGTTRIVVDKVANVRADTKIVLGVVGTDWTPFQNSDVAQFCEELAEQSDEVKIESAGSIRGGAKIWFLLKGESFSVRNTTDEVLPYILVSNGFDGGTGFRCTPTTVRVVCSNTLHMVIPQAEREGRRMRSLTPASFVCLHTKNLRSRVEEAKSALQLYGRSLDQQRDMIDTLAARDVTSEAVKQFFLECYTRDFGPIPTESGAKKREKAMRAIVSMTTRFDREAQVSGANAWTLMNGYTGWLQNDNKSRLKDAEAATEATLGSNLFGTNSDRSLQTFAAALAI